MREQRARIVENNDVKIAVLEEQMKVLQRHVENIESQNKEILATLNKGKGAFTFAVIMAGAIGAILTAAGKALFSRM